MSRLAELDYEDEPVTKADLREVFDKLAEFYYESKEELRVDLTIGELKGIFERLARVDNLPEAQFSGRDPGSPITVQDLNLLLSELADHFASGSGNIEAGLDY